MQHYDTLVFSQDRSFSLGVRAGEAWGSLWAGGSPGLLLLELQESVPAPGSALLRMC